ncbi:hypothetical protein [Streptomyces sp. NPDC002785]|uniref:hypothetical protein n=1 Tax=Streptomyces sp. NPDC002785 TaxID=3154543 RepID=UPI00332D2964
MTPSTTPPALPALLGWLRANGIDPNCVPEESPLSISKTSDGQHLINYTEFVRDQDGNALLDATDSALCAREKRIAPCVVEPDPELRIPVAKLA